MGKTRVLGLALLALSVAMLGACKSDGKKVTEPSSWFGGDDTEAVAIHNHWQGSDPAFKTAGGVLIDSAAKLQETGSTELTNLNVNFDTQSIVVFSLGEQPTGGYWAWITGVQRSGGKLWVQATVNRPADGAATAQVMSYPVAAAVIDRQSGITQVYTDSNAVQGQEVPSASAAPAAAPAEAPAPMEPAPASEAK